MSLSTNVRIGSSTRMLTGCDSAKSIGSPMDSACSVMRSQLDRARVHRIDPELRRGTRGPAVGRAALGGSLPPWPTDRPHRPRQSTALRRLPDQPEAPPTTRPPRGAALLCGARLNGTRTAPQQSVLGPCPLPQPVRWREPVWSARGSGQLILQRAPSRGQRSPTQPRAGGAAACPPGSWALSNRGPCGLARPRLRRRDETFRIPLRGESPGSTQVR